MTRSPTCTLTAVSRPPLRKPRFCSLDADSAPDDDTAVNDGRALHAGGLRLRRGRRARAGGERDRDGQQPGPGVRPNQRKPSPHARSAAAADAARDRGPVGTRAGTSLAHAALLFPHPRSRVELSGCVGNEGARGVERLVRQHDPKEKRRGPIR